MTGGFLQPFLGREGIGLPPARIAMGEVMEMAKAPAEGVTVRSVMADGSLRESPAGCVERPDQLPGQARRMIVELASLGVEQNHISHMHVDGL